MLITEILDKWPQRTLTYVVYFFQFPLYLLPRCQVWKSRLVLTTCRAWVPLISRGSPLMLAGPEQRIWGWEAAGLTGGLVAHPIIASKGLFTDLCLLLFWVLGHCFFFFSFLILFYFLKCHSYFILHHYESLFICSEDYEGYTREAFQWKRQTRETSQGDSLKRRTSSQGRSCMVYGSSCDSWYSSDHQYGFQCNNKGVRGMANKVIH